MLTPVYIFRSGDWSYLWPVAQWIASLACFLPVSGKLNPVMWSLVVEIQFYLILPIVFACLRKVPVRWFLWIITGGVS